MTPCPRCGKPINPDCDGIHTCSPMDQMRCEFERLYSDNYESPKAIEKKGDDYIHMRAVQAWEWFQAGYQAGRAHQVTPLCLSKSHHIE